MSVVAIPGQPGQFRDERRSLELADYLDGNFTPARRRGLRGLGDARQDAIAAKLADITAQYNATQTNATKLLAAFGPLSETALFNLGQAIKDLKDRDAGALARMTGAQFAGVVRMGMAAGKGNIMRAEAIVHGHLAGNEAIAESLLNAAKNVLDAIGSVVNNGTVAVGTAAGYAQSVGLGVVGGDDIAVAAIIAVGVLVAVGIAFEVYTYVRQSRAASEGADRACAAGAAAGHPCTTADWSAAHAAAAAAERALSPFPNLDPLVESAGSLLFWGGLAAVGAVLAYGAWVAAPAASITRERLRSGASRLGNMRGTTDEHRERARRLTEKSERERAYGNYSAAFVSAVAALEEAEWISKDPKAPERSKAWRAFIAASEETPSGFRPKSDSR